ncbi:MAG: hypothetical protein DPW18_02420 [Chloroflexi bacterium]|nr:hypothetical protein [Chloroflexota bacterium]MDL1942706.1 hypothetical protein [Chloroflexi bacterium CFX2]
MKIFQQRDWLWSLPLSLLAGAALSAIQPGNWLTGFLGFSFLILLSLFLLSSATRWGGQTEGLSYSKTLAWMAALAFGLRFAGGVGTYLLLPVVGHAGDEEQSAGFAYTDAYRRDAQAWELASSDRPILDAFNEKFAYDQYGGLLAFSALIYRYLSPDAHRVLMLVLLSGLMGALGVPFLWKAVRLLWGERHAAASGWIFALFPESLLLGGSAMREPYLLAFSAFCLWGFVDWQFRRNNKSLGWLAFGITGMLLVSPAIALVTLVILGGWLYFAREHSRISWWMVAAAALVFVVGLFVLSSALERGNLGGGSPLAVLGNFVRESLKWNVYKVEEESGWVQKLFDQMPDWMQLPFVTIYGVLQPVLPAILIAPTAAIWKVIGILRAAGWYALLPALILSFGAAAAAGQETKRKLNLWLSLVVWAWILFAALRGGGDQWDNPRYRTILFMWQAILAGGVWVWWRETRNVWVGRVLAMEAAFVLVFANWYAGRYWHVGVTMEFETMVAVILGLWVFILVWGVWRDRRMRAGHSV